MKKRFPTKLITLFTAASALLFSCSAPKNIAYLQNAESMSMYQLQEFQKVYEAKIMAKDVLTISVNTTIPEAGAPFNLGSNAGSMLPTAGYNNVQGAQLQTYVVDSEGYINYPIVGKIKVLGLTRVEAQELIKNSIHPIYITEVPIVNVRFKNYKVSVLGEVSRPGQFVVENEQCTILDALAMAGDLTIYGRRDNIMLIREDNNGKKQIARIDLQNPYQTLDPQFYYLQQNDVLYVEPNKTKARDSKIGQTERYTLSIITTLVSVATLIVTITR